MTLFGSSFHINGVMKQDAGLKDNGLVYSTSTQSFAQFSMLCNTG